MSSKTNGPAKLPDHATTGDGTIAALQVLGALVQSGKKASELLHLFDPVPQLLKNVRFSGGKPLDDPKVKAVIAQAEATLAGGQHEAPHRGQHRAPAGGLLVGPGALHPALEILQVFGEGRVGLRGGGGGGEGGPGGAVHLHPQRPPV